MLGLASFLGSSPLCESIECPLDFFLKRFRASASLNSSSKAVRKILAHKVYTGGVSIWNDDLLKQMSTHYPVPGNRHCFITASRFTCV